MAQPAVADPLLPHLAVCVTFFFDRKRLVYLSQVVSSYVGLATKADLYIVTNVDDAESRREICAALPTLPEEITLHFVTPTGLGHPYLLTWTHREIFQEVVRAGQATHFLYSEDDLAITYENVAYWLRARTQLHPHGLIPAFFRVEQDQANVWFSTDCKRVIKVYKQARLELEGQTYLCAPNPYQGSYLLDRELMEEFASSPAFSPDFGNFGIREKAAQGLIYATVPRGYSSRNLLLVDLENRIVPRECWIHHLPNNYVNDPNSRYGKVPMAELLVTSRLAHTKQRMLGMLTGR